MPKEADKARPQPVLKDEEKKRYESPELRKREKLAEVTGQQPPAGGAIPVT